MSGERTGMPADPAPAAGGWECGMFDGERLGYVCGRPKDHKGMHRRRTPLAAPPPSAAREGEALRLLRALVIGVFDVDHNFRDGDGLCIDCGRSDAWDHEDPDCSLSVVVPPLREARAFLAMSGEGEK